MNIRNAKLSDKFDFSDLILISSPYFSKLFGYNIKFALEYMFCKKKNLFSFEHVYFAELNGKNLGMILSYDWKIKSAENFKTGILLFKALGIKLLRKIKTLLKFNKTVGNIQKEDYYISNIAVFPKYRGKGVGKALISKAEKDAKISKAHRIVLDVERENEKAISFYMRLGYKKVKEFSIELDRFKTVNFYRMVKVIASQ